MNTTLMNIWNAAKEAAARGENIDLMAIWNRLLDRQAQLDRQNQD